MRRVKGHPLPVGRRTVVRSNPVTMSKDPGVTSWISGKDLHVTTRRPALASQQAWSILDVALEGGHHAARSDERALSGPLRDKTSRRDEREKAQYHINRPFLEDTPSCSMDLLVPKAPSSSMPLGVAGSLAYSLQYCYAGSCTCELGPPDDVFRASLTAMHKGSRY